MNTESRVRCIYVAFHRSMTATTFTTTSTTPLATPISPIPAVLEVVLTPAALPLPLALPLGEEVVLGLLVTTLLPIAVLTLPLGV